MKLKQVHEKGKLVGAALFKQALTRGYAGWPHVVSIVDYFGLLEKEAANEATETKKGLREVSKMEEVPDGLDVLLELDWGSLQKLDKAFFKGARDAMMALYGEQRKFLVEVSSSTSGHPISGLGSIPDLILSFGSGSSAT